MKNMSCKRFSGFLSPLKMGLLLPIVWQMVLAVIFCFPNAVHAAPDVRPVVLIVGTRPEAIKMAPVYFALKAKAIPTFLCSTGQHAEMLDEVFSLFGIAPDVELKVMKPGQDLFYLTETLLARIKELYESVHPSLVIVQGDTSSAMTGALAAFYLKIPVAHVEAGLRTGNIQAPFPEELNRRIITLVSSIHFAPTSKAFTQLRSEGVSEKNIVLTGNTVVDALHSVINKMKDGSLCPLPALMEVMQKQKAEGRNIILLTAHRRESFGGGLQKIFRAMKHALEADPKLFVIFPVHPNPIVRKAIEEVHLNDVANILFTPPLSYHNLVYVMNEATGVASDSGGISEEAISLKKPLLILRSETDRPEAITSGGALLVGTDESKIEEGLLWMKQKMAQDDGAPSPFGDGNASNTIASVVEEFLNSNLHNF
jgi:UDP-N-acetylglucosamine 2-epimerase (non-hydrolysing)